VDADANGAEPAAATSAGTTSGKVKHPNQYTYRPKGASSSGNGALGAPSTSGANGSLSAPTASASPTKSKFGEGRRSGGASGGRSGTPLNSASGDNAGGSRGSSGASWGIPDHLSHLAGTILPSPGPVPLRVPAVTVSHGEVRRESRDENPTRVRWPGRRMTIGEMRKRVRGILDFVGRWPAEESVKEEGEGADPTGDGEDASMAAPTDEGKPVQPPIGAPDAAGTDDGPSAPPTKPRVKSRAEEVEELVRDLIAFEQRFGVAALLAASGGSTPAPAPPQPLASASASAPPAKESPEPAPAPVEDAPMEATRSGPTPRDGTPPPVTSDETEESSAPALVGLGLTPSDRPAADESTMDIDPPIDQPEASAAAPHQPAILDTPLPPLPVSTPPAPTAAGVASTEMLPSPPAAIPAESQPATESALSPTKALPSSIPTAGDELAAAVGVTEAGALAGAEQDVATASLLAEATS
jgi:hypothetical protein